MKEDIEMIIEEPKVFKEEVFKIPTIYSSTLKYNGKKFYEFARCMVLEAKR
ncbi:MAG: hypothetical protein LBI98_00860 [Endomicrobium sp.]|jgi:tRNA U55 pseudouridine synthase TruB|nr:hypothetical protein [Endomicrobium sp.]